MTILIYLWIIIITYFKAFWGVFMDEMGERIKLIRSRLGLNQGDFAERLGFGRAALVSKYELGHLEPGVKTLIRISELDQESLDWLIIGGVDKKKPADKKLQKLKLKQIKKKREIKKQ